MKRKTIYEYNSCMQLLIGEVKILNKKLKKLSPMEKFINYMISINGTFIHSKMKLLWTKNKLTKFFLESIKDYDFNDIVPLIIEILCGNFSKAKKKFISDKNNKPIIFYLIPFNKNQNILFNICIRADLRNDSIAHEYIYFMTICEESEFKEYTEKFINKISLEKNKNKFPEVPFDKIGLYSNYNMFFKKIEKDEKEKLDICFPIENIILIKEIIFDKIIPNKKEVKLKNIHNYFKSNVLNNSIIEEMGNNQIDNIILDILDNNEIFKLNLSNQEKKLVKFLEPTILSGRPGTGKTTVTLIKLFIIYCDFIFKKCKREKFCIDYNYINNNYLKLNLNKDGLKNEAQNENISITNNLRIIFTSLSKYLCNEEQKLFGEFIYKSSQINYNFITKEDYLGIYSFRDVKSYPLFINFRKLMFMIDGSLTFQFFHRQNLSISLVQNLNDEIDYNSESEYLCNNYEIFHLNRDNKENNISFFYSLPKIIFEIKNKKKVISIKLKESNENNFIEFYKVFMEGNKENVLRNNLKKLNLNPIEIYSQLYSVIKGSLISHLYPNNCISKEDYKNRGKKLTDLPDLDTIYDICMEYENYKRGKYFDMQDVVNHLIRQVKIEFKNDIKLIDFLFIDEVQDLTINQIYLLSLISKNVQIYGGDTCQTISKINRFRFSDLKTIFYGFSKIIKGYKKPENAYLSLNFRLNSKILRLSNFFAYLMRDMFPNTLDKVQDDFSIKVTDFYPFYVSELTNLEKALTKKLIQNNRIFVDGIWRDLTPNDLNLFKYHCFICRDDPKTKELLEKKNLNCYTISECKGLEKHFVIVYNFFTSSKFIKEWNIIFSNIIPSEKWENMRHLNYLNLQDNLCHEQILKLINKLNIIYDTNNEEEIKEKILNEIKTYIYPELNYPFDKHKLFEFCSEIKQFYVIITRAQTFLMFYESEPDFFNKFYFYRYCTEKRLIVDKRFIDGNIIINKINDYFKKNKIHVLSIEQFREDAINEYYKSNYSNALYFFEQIGELKWIKKCKIILDYEKLENLNNNQINNNDVIKKKKNQLCNNILKNISNLLEEGENEEMIYIIMAYCYKIQEKYDKAISIYEKYKKYKECANIYYKLREYEKAIKYFTLSGDDYYVIECYYKNKQFENMFKYANSNYKQLKRYSYSKIYHDYSYDYLLTLLPNINNLNEYLGSITLRKKLLIFFGEYIRIINLLDDPLNKEKTDLDSQNFIKNIYSVEDAVNDLNLKKENDLVYNMINAYYFRFKGSIYKEIIRLIPDIYILKFNEPQKEKIIQKMENVNIGNIMNIYLNAEFTEKQIESCTIPLLIYNNFFNLSF